MKKLILMAIAGIFLAIAAQSSFAAIITIDEVTDVFTSGDFKIYGNNVAAGTGLNYEVVKFGTSKTASTSYDGAAASSGIADDQSPHGDVSIGELWSHLKVNGINSTNKLIFGFDINENDDDLDITNLQILLDGQTYSLAEGDTVHVHGLSSGSSVADARFEVNLGYDFMTKYNAASGTGLADGGFKIIATHADEVGGFEEYFLGAGYLLPPTSAVPEPASMALLGIGLAGMGLARRKKLSV